MPSLFTSKYDAECALDNSVVSIGFSGLANSEALFKRLEEFLKPAFQRSKNHVGKMHNLTIHFERFNSFPSDIRKKCNTKTVIRDSGKESFRLHVLTHVSPNGVVYAFDEVKQTGFEIYPETNHATIYTTQSSFVHLIEYLRYASLIIEDSHGTVALHAGAVHGPKGIILILGDKGAGKTTTQLDLIISSGCKYYSGDKVLIDVVDGSPRLRPWPDFPHIGLGTLRQYEDLIQKFNISDTDDTSGKRKSDGFKELIEVSTLRSHIPLSPVRDTFEVDHIRFPDVSAKEHKSSRIPEKDKSPRFLSNFIENPIDFTPARWHGMFATEFKKGSQANLNYLNALCHVDWLKVQGTIVLEKEQETV